jgi:hypothetical protein
MRQQSFADLKARAEKLAAAADGPDYSPADSVASRLGVAQVYAYQGEMDRAIAQFEAAFRIAEIVVALESNVTGPFTLNSRIDVREP